MTDEHRPAEDEQEPKDAPASPSFVAAALAFWRNVRERKVAQWGVTYAAGAFALVQGVLLVADALGWSPVAGRIVLAVAATGLPIVLIVAWHHGDLGRQQVTRAEAGLIAICVAGGAALIALAIQGPATQGPPKGTTATIAVLPFTSLNADAESALYAESVSASVSSALSGAGLSVVSQATSASYRGAARANAARNLGARYLVDGSVRHDNDGIRAYVRVDDARSGVTLISETLESPKEEATHLPARIAARVASVSWALAMRTSRMAGTEATESFFRNHTLWQRGEYRAAWEGARAFARTHRNEALTLQQFAVLTGFAYWDIPIGDLPDAIREARAADERARNLAPGFGEAYIDATVLMPPHRWAERAAHLRRGMQIDNADGPSLPSFLGSVYLDVGRTRDAEGLFRLASARDPFNPGKAANHLYALSVLGDRAGAHALIERAQQFWPGHTRIALVRFRASSFVGSPSEAERLMRDRTVAQIVEPADATPVVAPMLRALDSRKPRDIAAASLACASPGKDTRSGMTCLNGFVALGRLDDAFRLADALYPARAATAQLQQEEWLRREGHTLDPRYLFKADMTPLRADPRFALLAQRIGLLEYWQEPGNEPDFCTSEPAPVCKLM